MELHLAPVAHSAGQHVAAGGAPESAFNSMFVWNEFLTRCVPCSLMQPPGAASTP